ncbi:hypothetical protein [Rhodococcus erythropolis]|uniref:hypothetical protein n=1 Tax=Rhodococcus erythropolis TaxID=1833 RepID=UPI00188554FE|nr:hypothetical protein [Rhodococcus erythropolis]
MIAPLAAIDMVGSVAADEAVRRLGISRRHVYTLIGGANIDPDWGNSHSTSEYRSKYELSSSYCGDSPGCRAHWLRRGRTSAFPTTASAASAIASCGTTLAPTENRPVG